MGKDNNHMLWVQGGCHCRRVRFEVLIPSSIEVEDCNCSICAMSGFLHLIVPKSRFRLLSGGQDCLSYQFNTHTAKHLFCRVCGVKSYYIPRSNPDGIDVNVKCLDQYPENVTVTPFDGRNWEKHAHTLRHKSND